MLEIGLHGLSLLLTVVVIGAVKKGGQSIPASGGFVAGMALAYCYARTGRPWSILADKAQAIAGNAGAEFGVAAAAIALSFFGWWWYTRPKLALSVVLGFLAMTAAQGSDGLWREVAGIIGSFVRIVAG